MAAASSALSFGLDDTQMQPQAPSPPQNSAPAAGAVATPPKKKRNPPGNPRPDSEVVALSPRTLMATNRFVCEFCFKGFQREQNLQLHRRGHNMPWCLKARNPRARRRVYVCPEPTCVYHDPSRALGDLTGIKKHYYRKHGEKNLKCERCDKRYAVESDWKAHSKTCDAREYRCDDCGDLFFRKDTFDSHRAMCGMPVSPKLHIMSPRLMNADLHVGSGSMSLELSGAGAQIHGFENQGQSSSAAAAQFLSVPSYSDPCVFHPQASGCSLSFLLGGAAPSPAQNLFADGQHSQGSQGSSLLHGKGKQPIPGLMQLPEHQHQPGSSNGKGKQPFPGLMQLPEHQHQHQHQHQPGSSNGKGKQPFPGLMQLPEHQHQHQLGSSNANANLLNLGFFSGNGGGSAGGQHARLVMQEQFNLNGGGGSSSNAEHGTLMAPVGIHLGGSFPFQYNPSPSAGLPHNSATALLMKAAQLGSTSSTVDGPSALLRAAGFSAAAGQGTSRATGEGASHEKHFHDLIMNSLAEGGGGFSGAAGFGAVDDGQLSTRDFLSAVRGAMAPPGIHIDARGLDPAQMK